MSYHSILIDRVFFVRWRHPAMSDVMPVLRAAQKAKNQLGSQVIGVSIVPADAPAPSDEVRKAMGRSMDGLLEAAESLHFILEGTGFKHSIARSALSTIFLFGGKRGRVFVHQSVREALATVSDRLTMPVGDILQMATDQKILTTEQFPVAPQVG